MGHERVGSLPRTRQWRAIVSAIATVDPGDTAQIATIADSTLRAVQSRFRRIHGDQGVQAAFAYLIALATNHLPPSDGLSSVDTSLEHNPSPAAVARGLMEWVHTHSESGEYAAIASRAGVDTVVEWTRRQNEQGRLFEESKSAAEIWQAASNARDFCEIARLFFSRFTERYMRYFLEREASSSIPSLEARETFGRNLRAHIQDVSHHAFETSKITQSFAAGWYNNHARISRPSDSEIQGFLAIAFGKLQEELQRETAV